VLLPQQDALTDGELLVQSLAFKARTGVRDLAACRDNGAQQAL